MKALTIKQPWASLITHGHKEFEFRTWQTKYRGKILIHAGLTKEKEYLDAFKNYNLDIQFGCIIGEAELVDCLLVDEKMNKELINSQSIAYTNHDRTGLYAWKLINIKKYNQPIYCKGALSLWEYDNFTI